MTLFNSVLDKAIRNRNLVKIIAGLDNFHIHQVIQIVKAAETAGATYVDIAANSYLLKEVKKNTSLPVCISSVDPQELYNTSLEGVDLVEVGNFDCLYNKNIYLSGDQVLGLAKEVIHLFPVTDVCITIPHILPLGEQVKLSYRLEKIGVKILQTEGYFAKIADISTPSQRFAEELSDHINCASSALTTAYSISKVVNVPVIAASGINVLSAPLSIFYGASGIGIGTAVRNCKTSLEMSKYIREVVQSVRQNRIETLNHLSSLTRFSSSFSSSVNVL
uniref:Uncharacterized protein ycf23 n=1 Tax=Rhodogorgon sp. TaxID=2485824 RepID=A0A3G3MI56_9FLOR|nr:hypothetical protein [Rhodogorgon sp.]